jgi:thiol-disulfide isomerase/thioredoxin
MTQCWARAALLVTLAAALAAAESDPVNGSVRTALSELRLPDLDGRTVVLSSYLGRGPVVLDFWATWCKPCLAAIPELNTLYDDFEARGLQVVGINEDGQRNAAKVKPFVRTRGIRFPVLLDLNRAAQSRLNAPALPTTLLLDRDGNVVHTSYGPFDPAELRAKIEALLPAQPAE